MSILLRGDVDQIQGWGLRQADDEVSCREVLTGTSTRKARTYIAVALKVVHQAYAEIIAEISGSPAERIYLAKHLHDAVSSAPVSLWTALADDTRAVVALEIAQRCRNMPFLNRLQDAPGLPIVEVMSRWEAEQSEKQLPAPSKRLMAFLEGAVLEDLATEPLHDEYVSKLHLLQAGFGLNIEELRTLLHVSRTSIQKWLAGGGISRDVQARIDEHLGQLARMESYWRPGLLPSIVRRPGRGLKGKTPLGLILKGKSDAVIEYFDALTDYGATA